MEYLGLALFSLSFVSSKFIKLNQNNNNNDKKKSFELIDQVYNYLPDNLSLTENELNIIKTGIFAALSAGEVILEGYNKYHYKVNSINQPSKFNNNNNEKENLLSTIHSKYNTNDLVTEIDEKSQDIIKKIILNNYQLDNFLGEEDIQPGPINSYNETKKKILLNNNFWIVDPLDGTTNFAYGIKQVSVIISYVDSSNNLLYGFIYDPFSNEFLLGIKNHGAYLNKERITCCQNTKKLNEALIGTGSPPNVESLEACIKSFNSLSKIVRGQRILGSAAQMLSNVCLGRLAGFFEPDLNAWDSAAGVLILREAGGKVTDVWGEEYNLLTRNVVATNGYIHDELLKVLQDNKMYMESMLHLNEEIHQNK